MVEDGDGEVLQMDSKKKKKKVGRRDKMMGRRTLKRARKSIQFIIVSVALITYTHTSPHASRCQNRASLVV